MYRFRKWYVDCLGPRKEFVFAYVADVQLGALHLRSLTVHLADPGSAVSVTRSFPLSAAAIKALDSDGIGTVQPGIKSAGLWPPQPATFELRENDCAIALHWENQPRFEPVIIPTCGNSSIIWKPLALPCAVSGRVNMGGRQIELQEASGYADYVDSTCLPPLVPVRTLRWGRISEPDFALAYIVASDRLGTRSWSQLHARSADSWFQGEDVCLRVEDTDSVTDESCDGGRAYSISAVSKGCQATVRFHPEACVQGGSFINQQTCRSILMRLLLKCLTRNPRGRKFLGHADLTFEGPGVCLAKKHIPCIDELVNL